MKDITYFLGLALSVLFLSLDSQAQVGGKFLILNFDCTGIAAGKAESIGDSLRVWVRKGGGQVVPNDEVVRLIRQKGMKESEINNQPEKLKQVISAAGAEGAAMGHVYSEEGLLIVEMKYLDADSTMPISFDPFVVSGMKNLYAAIPEMARIVVSPDKLFPRVVSVEPADGKTDVGQFAELKIKFSEPMNPATYSLAGEPKGMWSRYGEVSYDSTSDTFMIRLHLYPNTKYQFSINGENSKGFKDLAGNPAPEFDWGFKTAR